MRKDDFGVCTCELEQQPKENCKMDIGWKWKICTSSEHTFNVKERKMF